MILIIYLFMVNFFVPDPEAMMTQFFHWFMMFLVKTCSFILQLLLLIKWHLTVQLCGEMFFRLNGNATNVKLYRGFSKGLNQKSRPASRVTFKRRSQHRSYFSSWAESSVFTFRLKPHPLLCHLSGLQVITWHSALSPPSTLLSLPVVWGQTSQRIADFVWRLLFWSSLFGIRKTELCFVPVFDRSDFLFTGVNMCSQTRPLSVL